MSNKRYSDVFRQIKSSPILEPVLFLQPLMDESQSEATLSLMLLPPEFSYEKEGERSELQRLSTHQVKIFLHIYM